MGEHFIYDLWEVQARDIPIMLKWSCYRWCRHVWNHSRHFRKSYMSLSTQRSSEAWQLVSQKTKMVDHMQTHLTWPVQLGGGSVEIVQDSTYLGSNITSDGEVKWSAALPRLQGLSGAHRSLSFRAAACRWRPRGRCIWMWFCQYCCMQQRHGPSRYGVGCLSGFHNRCIRSNHH